jgi:type II secretory pathway pseudopilin PulG
MNTQQRGACVQQGGLHKRGGVTLIEVMISIVLVSTILLVSINASATLLRNNLQQRNANHSAHLALQILDEVSSRDFRDRVNPVFGIESGENSSDRTTFDDVDDYHGYKSTPPTHRDGSVISGYDGWSFSVTIAPADPVANGISTTSADESSPLRIIGVVCTTPEGTEIREATMVSDTASDIADTTSYDKWRRIKLSFEQREINVTAPLRNQPDSTF